MSGVRDKTHETVVNMLSMLTLEADHDPSDQDRREQPLDTSNHRMLLLNMTNSPESCLALRRAGCIPLLIEILHPPSSPEDGIPGPSEVIRSRAARALKNIVQFNPDDKTKRKELRVLKLLEGIRLFTEQVSKVVRERETGSSFSMSQLSEQSVDNVSSNGTCTTEITLTHPTANMTTLMKLSFDEEHRHTMCLLGAIHAIAELILSDHKLHQNSTLSLQEECLLLRRYSGMTLTNLTFGDDTNKALLCAMRHFLSALVSQLDCENEDVTQVTASVLRNLSWHADSSTRASLSDSGAVTKLTLAAIRTSKESTLKATLSALWNLSAHSAVNKEAICTAAPDALPFLVTLLRPSSPVLKGLKTPLTIVENAGGILRNVAPQIAARSDLRKVIRDAHVYEILLEHLKSGSLTVVSNACGTLWNLSQAGTPDCDEDQRRLLDLNAVPMLKNLVYSKHERISQGASCALRNLLSSRFAKDHSLHLDSRLTAQIYCPPGSSGNVSPRTRSALSDRMSVRSGGSGINPVLESPEESFEPFDLSSTASGRVPPFAHQSSSGGRNFGGFSSRPAHIAYSSVECEPLDLTLTSAKSSPIHVISAAEFGNPPVPAERSNYGKRGGRNHPPFLNPPLVAHGSGGSSASLRNPQRYTQQKKKLNQSCPEILERYFDSNQSSGQPRDFTSGDECSHLETEEETGAADCSGGGGGGASGDTTFNYSLKFQEMDEDEFDTKKGPGVPSSHHKEEDTVKTYCYEGTPNNFSSANSCQDLVQELVHEDEKSREATVGKLQPIDEQPKQYYVENTPAIFSRTSSLSSINSDGHGGENKAELDNQCPQNGDNNIITPPIPIVSVDKKAASSTSASVGNRKFPHLPLRTTFSAEETPLMFSRCSSVASLDSLDNGHSPGAGHCLAAHNDDDSDFSRRASEVVSPSDLPDSPRAMVPPVRLVPDLKKTPDFSKKTASELNMEVDTPKIFTLEEKSGLNSCRSLSPLTVDGEVLPVLKIVPIDLSIPPTPSARGDSLSPLKSKTPPVPPPKPKNQTFVSKVKFDETQKLGGETAALEDQLTVFAVEGTPFYGVSNATSFSDIVKQMEEEECPENACPAKNPEPNEAFASETKKDTSALEPEVELVQTASVEPEPIYSDVQLLQKCIRAGRAAGIPKSKSDFKITTTGNGSGGDIKAAPSVTASFHSGVPPTRKEVDDPDLAALIMKGRKLKDKPKEKDKPKKPVLTPKPRSTERPSPKPRRSVTTNSSAAAAPVPLLTSSNENSSPNVSEKEQAVPNNCEVKPQEGEQGDIPAAIQMSVMSLGSEWNDETPTFSSPIPSMSISKAFKLVRDNSEGSTGSPSSPKLTGGHQNMNNIVQNINTTSSISGAELLDNIEPPSIMVNTMTSSDCPPVHVQLKSRPKDRIARKFNNNSSTQSNLAGQKPPPEMDLDHSLISIKSEIFDMSMTSDSIFQSAISDVSNEKNKADCPDAGIAEEPNTYTIFPPADAQKSSDLISEDTVVSDDFTDAEDIDEFETAGDVTVDGTREDEPEVEKRAKDEAEKEAGNKDKDECKLNAVVSVVDEKQEVKATAGISSPIVKPLMEVHPLDLSGKYNTFVVKKIPGSGSSNTSSPKQKRRDDPERYRTRTITPPFGRSHSALGACDRNGNPLEASVSKFATFRVSQGARVAKPACSEGNSTDSSPCGSPKGIRGRRKPLYSSLPPKSVYKPGPSSLPGGTSPVKPGRGSPGMYVRATRASELRAATSHSREISPGNSKTGSNSSLNTIQSAATIPGAAPPIRPKVAPRPPVRTSTMSPANGASSSTFSSANGSSRVPFGGSTSSVQVLKSNSTFGFGQAMQMSNPNDMKGYSTLPKSSKLGTPGGIPLDNNKGNASTKIGKLSSFWRKVSGPREPTSQTQQLFPFEPEKGCNKKQSKFGAFFGRKDKKDKPTHHQQPNQHPSSIDKITSGGPSGVWVRRGEGENKATVAPFNYIPPDAVLPVPDGVGPAANVILPYVIAPSSSTTNAGAGSGNGSGGSAKITTV